MSLQLEFTGGELTPSLWAKSNAPVYGKGLKTCKNFMVLPVGGVTNRPGTVFVGECGASSATPRLEAFEFSSKDTLVMEFGRRYVRFIKHDNVTHKSGYVETSPGSGVPYEVVSPYLGVELRQLQMQQIADVVTIVHPNHPPMELSRLSKGTPNWTLTYIAWQGNIPDAPASLTVDNQAGSGGARWTYAVTAVDANGNESLAVKGTTRAPGSWDDGDRINLSWPAVTGADHYRVYLAKYGVFGVIGESRDLTFSDDNITPDFTQGGLPQPREIFPERAGRRPATLSVHNMRMMYGGSAKEPQHVWGTKPNNYHDLSTHLPISPDSAIDWFLASNQLDEVEHLFSWRKQLLVFTGGGLWVAEGDTAVMSATDFQLSPNLGVECSTVKPLMIGDNIVFLGMHGDVVYDMQYSFDADGYREVDRSVHASHIFHRQTVVQWAYQRRPYSIVWAVTDTGNLLGLTYIPSATEGQGVWAWHRHDTQGEILSITTVKEHDEDVIYLIVKRTINGQVKRYVERMHHRVINDNITTDGIFMDCAGVAPLITPHAGVGPAGSSGTTVVSGLDHLEGMAVSVMADGDSVPGLTVSGGQITIPFVATYVFVGLGYTCDLEPLNYMGDATSRGYKSAQGQRKRPVALSMYVEDSRGFQIGADEKSLYDTPRLAMDGLYTGEVKMNLAGAWQKDAGLLIRHTKPLPLTILSLSPVYEAGS